MTIFVLFHYKKICA